MAYQIILKDSVLEDLRQICLGVYDAGQKLTVEELLEKMMDHPEVPIHYPYHHFIMPAALLTLAAMEQSESREALEEMLDTAKVRSMQVPGGVCGIFGTCGAGVGAGIFMSVWTQTTPVSGKTWQWCNELTGRCLQKIASVEGPRCCKRTSYLSVSESVPYINEKLGLHLQNSPRVVCKYYEKNKECRHGECPYYPLNDKD